MTGFEHVKLFHTLLLLFGEPHIVNACGDFYK